MSKKPKFNYKYYKLMKELAQNKCEICGIESKVLTRRLSIDHCHKTNKIRGLLCHKCNWLLGLFNDDIDYLNKIIKYLQKPLTKFDYEGPYKFKSKQAFKDRIKNIENIRKQILSVN